VFRDLASGFASRSSALPRRRYATERIEPDWTMLEPFGSRTRRARSQPASGEVLGYLPSPRRPGQARTELLAVSNHSISVVSGAGPAREVSIDRVHGLEATFSTLRGRIATIGDKRIAMTYPSTLGASAAPIIRLARRLLANS
jgi:hypothetical protein